MLCHRCSVKGCAQYRRSYTIFVMDEKIAVIGAGVIGCAVTCALAREGRHVVLFDRAEPGTGGASFGNVGHIAAELVQPLPSPQLLFGFWRELFALDGPLEVPLRRLGAFAPWAWRFARAAFSRAANTRHLAPLVQPAASAFEQLLHEIGRGDLLRRNGHAQIWFGKQAQRKLAAEGEEMQRLGIPTRSLAREPLDAIAAAARQPTPAGLLFPDSGHVTDPLEVTRALLRAAQDRGASFQLTHVDALSAQGCAICVHTEAQIHRF